MDNFTLRLFISSQKFSSAVLIAKLMDVITERAMGRDGRSQSVVAARDTLPVCVPIFVDCATPGSAGNESVSLPTLPSAAVRAPPPLRPAEPHPPARHS